MTQLPAAIAIRLKGKTSFNVAMMVIEELCAENAALRAETEKLAAENKRLQDQLAQLQAKLALLWQFFRFHRCCLRFSFPI